MERMIAFDTGSVFSGNCNLAIRIMGVLTMTKTGSLLASAWKDMVSGIGISRHVYNGTSE